jgi:predicted Rossmann fold flavoprotein
VPAIVVIGAGAAGFMAAIHAAGEGADVLLLERTKDGGRKILISGGGRCNVLPSRLDPGRYVTASSANSMRRLLTAWPLPEQRAFFEGPLGLPLALEPETGKLFPVSNRARDVRDALARHAADRGATIRYNARVDALQPLTAAADQPHAARWQITLEDGDTIDARSIILATGGLSVPATGSDGTGLRIVRRLGHTIHDTYPALTPLTATPPPHAHLAGISLEVTLRAPLRKGAFETTGGFLFTHRGYSGPAVLDVSHLAVLAAMRQEQQQVLVQWTADDDHAWDRTLRETTTGEIGPLLRRRLPGRLAETLLDEAGVAHDTRLSQLRRDQRARLVTTLARYPLPWNGDEGYKKAEVTGGGVALTEIDPTTLESRIAPGLFLCGEILDAFGPIGGYNFAWAWSTGRAAGIGAARSSGP